MAVALLTFAPVAFAQGPSGSSVVRLVLVERGTRHPIPDVEIANGERGVIARSDSSGAVVMRFDSASTVFLSFRHLGYVADTLWLALDADTLLVTQGLVRTSQRLPVVTVEGATDMVRPFAPRLAGFEERRARHQGGAFLTHDEIAKRGHLRLIDAIRRIANVRVVDSAGVQLLATNRMRKPDLNRGTGNLVSCVMRVAVDGLLKEWGFVVDDIAVEEVHGVEVHMGPSTLPPEYAGMRRDVSCGVILIWTRDR